MHTSALTLSESERWTRIGALSALAMLLGYLETFVPIPIPGVKLGLANVAVLIALAEGDVWGACWVGVVKVLAAGLLFGSPVTMAYSAAGTLLSLLVMAPLSRLRTMSMWMVSVVGALAHEAGQLLVAQAMLGTSLVWYGAPPLLLAGCATGALCGAVAERSLQLMREGVEQPASPERLGEASSGDAAVPHLAGTKPRHRMDPHLALVALGAFSLVTLRLGSPTHLAAALALATVACVFARVRVHDALLALRPVAFIALVTVVAQILSQQGGTPVAAVGAVTITNEALAASTTSVLRLASLVAASLAFVHVQTADDMLEGISWLLSPLRKAGLRVEGPLHALEVALRLLPLLAGSVGSTTASLQSTPRTLRSSLDALPQLIVEAYRMAEGLGQNS